MSGLVLGAFVGATLLASWLAAREHQGARRVLAAGVIAATIPVVWLWGLWLVGGIGLAGAGIGLVLGLGGALWWRPETDSGTEEGWMGLPVLAAVGAWWAGMAVSGARIAWDDQTYHAVAPAWWLQTGTLEIPPFGYQGTFPLHAEAVSLWFMLPTGDDVMASLGIGVWALLGATALLVLTRRIGGGTPIPALVAAAFLASPPLRELATTFSATDLAAASLALAALALTDEEHPAPLLSGLAMGGAVATKVLLVPAAGLLALFWLRRDRRAVAWFLGGALLVGAPWYVRTWLVTGNPLFPAATGPFGGPFDAAAARETSLLRFVLEEGGRPSFWGKLVALRADWPPLLGALAVLGTLGLGRAVADPRRRPLALLLLGVAAVVTVAFVVAPFSGTRNAPNSALHGFERYLALPFALGLVGLGGLGPWSRIGVGVGLLAGIAWAMSDVPLAVLGACLAGGLGVFALQRQRSVGAWLGPGLVGAGLLGLALSLPWIRTRTDERAFSWTPASARARSGEGLYRAVDALPPGRLAHLDTKPRLNRFVAFLFGRRLQHTPVALADDGRALPPLHVRWKSEDPSWWSRWSTREALDSAAFWEAVRDQQIDHVVISRGPLCRDALPDHRADLVAERVHASDCGEIWSVR